MPTAAPPPARFAWLDLYRGAAVLVMIETHVCNTFLAPGLRATDWFARLTYLNGLVAPAFLFIAGYASGLAMRRVPVQTSGIARRLGRLAGIAAIGFALHFPWAELAAARWQDALLVGTRVDILPCLAVSLAVLAVVQKLAGRWGDLTVAILAAGVVILAPRAAGWIGGPVPLVAWINQTTGSLFPLLPWAAFAFVGCLASARPTTPGAFLIPLLGTAAAAFALGRADLSSTSPAFFFERLAWILAFVPACAWVAPRLAPPAILFAGRESLVMYVAHLLIIPALAALGCASLGRAATGALVAAVIAGTFGATWLWRSAWEWREKTKTQRKKEGRL